MRRLAVILGWMLLVSTGRAAEARVCKALPQFLDKNGRQSLSPSLYERDAYQAYLRKHPKLQGSLQLVVEWKPGADEGTNLSLRAELRGLVTNSLQTITLEQPAVKNGFFSSWAKFKLTGEQYKTFGELVAWRVTLWNGKNQLSELKSFLWSGVQAGPP